MTGSLLLGRHRPSAVNAPGGRRVSAARALGLCILLVFLIVPAAGRAAGTADEIHYTFTGPTSVGFDWRGTATDIRYGPTTSYGSAATAQAPTRTRCVTPEARVRSSGRTTAMT